MLWSRTLSEPHELATFQREFAQRSGNPVPLEYLRHGRVRGYFDWRGRMLGGYVVNDRLPLRYYDWLSPDERAPRPTDKARPEEFVEISCIWIDGARIKYDDRGQIYLESIVVAMRTGKPYILGGTFVERVRDQQMAVMTHLFRHGVSEFRGQPAPYWVYYGERDRIIGLFLKQVVLFVWKDAKHLARLGRGLWPTRQLRKG